ncbi:MAG: ABC-F family ATP-binding cassette domain-containing protein [Actinomycetia bacterium]|nr:ABC-F family ATP-binding cassette domain-containing protein [Actinomycetes bacterium]
MAGSNLINLNNVRVAFGAAPVLDDVSLGVQAGQRIGIVGRNGAGKSTLLRLFVGDQSPDSGRVTRTGGLRVGHMAQAESFDTSVTVREHVLGDAEEHEWASDAAARSLLTALLGGLGDTGLDRVLNTLSGGELRRVELARLLLSDLDLLVLDEPTNHLDMTAIAWLANYLKQRKSLAVVVVTHDRWLLDELAEETWEVAGGAVHQYDGGYSAYVLARAERERQAATEANKRNQLVRKELAWLRRGPPARTSKPKFRIDLANELIQNEPPARSSADLLAFANSRLGKQVWETHDISLKVGDKPILKRVNWNVGPGARIAILGVNGAGKTSLVRMMLGELKADSGKLIAGKTIKPAYLSQRLDELNPKWRVIEAVEDVALRVQIAKGRELSASQLCERLGFGPDAQWTPVGDLSGGEKRRLQLTRLLMTEPNVLVLDEPTNDFDVETLTSLEDLLDSFGGTLMVVTHDRYFAERVCDDYVALLGDGKLRELPSGVGEYLTLVSAQDQTASPGGKPASQGPSKSADERALRKKMARAENTIRKADAVAVALHDRIAQSATDYTLVAELNAELTALNAKKEAAEEDWFACAEELGV